MSRASTRTRQDAKTGPDLYAHVTAQIIADLQKGVRPWTRPWDVHPAGTVSRPMRHNLIPYSGVNVLLLWTRALEAGYASAVWMTFRQARALGCSVRKGEKAVTIIYADRVSRTEQDEDGQEVERSIAFLKTYSVFNLDQIDGLPETFIAPPARLLPQTDRIFRAESPPPARPWSMGAARPATGGISTPSSCRRSKPFIRRRTTTPPWPMSWSTGPATLRG